MDQEKYPGIPGGEKQKINLLRAFVRDRKVIILDEPTSGLDQKAIKKLLEYLSETKHDKIHFLITHEYNFDHLANKVIQL
ncbi:ATP-binding cassette domain-containing protein [Enterococcus casseliflavus]|uniref:ATP-binding cassette domain-containing protein n=1 Tax=Enterococcus casseliflavus TaxID=37734 RepID=UPI001329B7A1|nr:ATP-binding cassette domain-containing protein [Enterococcus casseliflavus]MUN96462.1 ATP-binding cassette domain-containing protein [Enterococcus casseliflavus]